MVPEPDFPTVHYDNQGDRLVYFVGGGSVQCMGSELDEIGLMPGNRIVVNRSFRTIDRIATLPIA